jgi:hypothetical protein
VVLARFLQSFGYAAWRPLDERPSASEAAP